MSGILDIENRTENWKTSYSFSPMFDGKSYKFAEMLVGSTEFQPHEVGLELFWKGVRYYRHSKDIPRRDLDLKVKEAYDLNFVDLRRDILDFQGFAGLTAAHYESTGDDAASKLTNNLLGTEIDVVLESPDHLFIGEVKHEWTFGADGRLVLVHQLVRQFVAATILMRLVGDDKKVVPFVVGDNIDQLKKTSQVRFVIDQCWLKESNVLDWSDVKRAYVVQSFI